MKILLDACVWGDARKDLKEETKMTKKRKVIAKS